MPFVVPVHRSAASSARWLPCARLHFLRAAAGLTQSELPWTAKAARFSAETAVPALHGLTWEPVPFPPRQHGLSYHDKPVADRLREAALHPAFVARRWPAVWKLSAPSDVPNWSVPLAVFSWFERTLWSDRLELLAQLPPILRYGAAVLPAAIRFRFAHSMCWTECLAAQVVAIWLAPLILSNGLVSPAPAFAAAALLSVRLNLQPPVVYGTPAFAVLA